MEAGAVVPGEAAVLLEHSNSREHPCLAEAFQCPSRLPSSYAAGVGRHRRGDTPVLRFEAHANDPLL